MRAWAVVVVLAGWISIADARDGIVIESHVGDRPTDAAKTLEPLLTELAQRGFEGGDSIGRLYEGKVSRPLQNSLPADFAKRLKDGQQEYIRGNYAAAVAALQPLIDTAHDNSGAFAKNQALRQGMLDGLAALALAQERNGDPKTARETFRELARSFPGALVPAATWGANAAKLFNEVATELKQQSLGRLIVKAPANAEVFVNERFEQSGNVIKNVLPGEYRIFVREGAKQSRTYRMTVSSAVDAQVSVDLDLDAAVHSSPMWTGLTYATAGDRDRFEAKHAAAIANAIDERAVVVVGIDATKGVIFGALVSLSGRDERRASIPLSASAASKTQLAHFLAGGPATPDLVVLVGAGAPGNSGTVDGGGSGPIAGPTEGGSRRWGGWPIITGVAAAAAIGLGTFWLVTDGECTVDMPPPCEFEKVRAPQGYAALGGGAVLAGITIYLIVTRPKAPSGTAFIAPTGDGGAIAGVSGRF